MNKTFLWVTILTMLTQGSFSNNIKTQTKELPKEQMQKQKSAIVKLAAQELNKTLPQTIDKYTTLARVEEKDTNLLYIFEINTGAKSDEAVRKEDRKRMEEAVTNGICRSSKRFLEAQIKISYIYTSKATKEKLFHFDVAQSDCLGM